MTDKLRTLLFLAGVAFFGFISCLFVGHCHYETKVKGWLNEKYPKHREKVSRIFRFICGAPIIIYLIGNCMWRSESTAIKVLKSERGTFIKI